MESNIFIRRIDNLGRIVIPREIRKSLKLEAGESLEISLSTDDIVIKKHSYIRRFSKTMLSLFDTLKKMYKVNIFITDLTKVVYATNLEYISKSLTSSYIKEIYKNKEKSSYKDIIIISNDIEIKNYYFRPLNINGDIVGSLLICSNEEFDEAKINCFHIVYNLLINNIET